MCNWLTDIRWFESSERKSRYWPLVLIGCKYYLKLSGWWIACLRCTTVPEAQNSRLNWSDSRRLRFSPSRSQTQIHPSSGHSWKPDPMNRLASRCAFELLYSRRLPNRSQWTWSYNKSQRHSTRETLKLISSNFKFLFYNSHLRSRWALKADKLFSPTSFIVIQKSKRFLDKLSTTVLWHRRSLYERNVWLWGEYIWEKEIIDNVFEVTFWCSSVSREPWALWEIAGGTRENW